jgi:hypothetical protein
MTNTKFRAYWYEAIDTTPAEEHIHFTRLMKGEKYLIAKTDNPNFVSITGKLFSNSGGFERVIDKHLHWTRVKPNVKLIDVSECVNTCTNG